jgi:hypothetical protein
MTARCSISGRGRRPRLRESAGTNLRNDLLDALDLDPLPPPFMATIFQALAVAKERGLI